MYEPTMTYEERRQRQWWIAHRHMFGTPAIELAKRYGLSVQTINTAIRKHPNTAKTRKHRQRRMWNAKLRGMSNKAIGARFSCSVATVYGTIKMLSTELKRSDRFPLGTDYLKRIIACIHDGLTEREAARKLGVSLGTLRFYCQQSGLTFAHAHRIPSSTYTIIARLCQTDETFSSIAREFGITRQRVYQVYERCRKEGIPVRIRQRLKTKMPANDNRR